MVQQLVMEQSEVQLRAAAAAAEPSCSPAAAYGSHPRSTRLAREGQPQAAAAASGAAQQKVTGLTCAVGRHVHLQRLHHLSAAAIESTRGPRSHKQAKCPAG